MRAIKTRWRPSHSLARLSTVLSALVLVSCHSQTSHITDGLVISKLDLKPGELPPPNLFPPSDSIARLAHLKTIKLSQIDYKDSLPVGNRDAVMHFDREGHDTLKETFLEKGRHNIRRSAYTAWNEPLYYEESGTRDWAIRYVYDSARHLLESITLNGGDTTETRRYSYDAAGRQTQYRIKHGNEEQIVQYTYDANGHKTEERRETPDGAPVSRTTFDYYPDGTRHWQRYYTGSEQEASQYWEMDQHGNTMNSRTPLMESHERHVYDDAGHLVSVEKLNAKGEFLGLETLTYAGDLVTSRFWKPAQGKGHYLMKSEYAPATRHRVTSFFNATIGALQRTHEWTYDENGVVLDEKERDANGDLQREHVLEVLERY